MTMLFVDPASRARLVTWLAWILLHTIWQGATIAALLWLTLRFVQKTRSSLRYGLACAAMLTMALAPAVTGFALRDLVRGTPTLPLRASVAVLPSSVDGPQVAMSSEIELTRSPAVPSEAGQLAPAQAASSNPVSKATVIRSFRHIVDRYAGFLVAAWLLGVAVSTARLWSSFRAVRVLRRSATPISNFPLLQTFGGLIQRLNLDSGIRLMQSAAVRVPTVLGWLRPVVLLPIACSCGLSLDQIEALLAHELGHVMRHDYLINMLQSFVETVLFYHPAVWWISNVIRNEREHCCDAIALRLVFNRGLYANSLVELARLATGPSQLAMSAGGGSLNDRIQRILNVPTSASVTSGPVVALTMAFLLTLLFAATLVPYAGADDPGIETPKPTKEAGEKDETTPTSSEPKAANEAALQAVEKPAQADGQKRRNPHSGGSGGGEIFYVLGFEAVQKELGLSEDAVAKIKATSELYRDEISATLPTHGVRIRNMFREGGGQTQSQEATREGMPVFKAAVAKFRPQLKEVLTADQYVRLQQITWQDMGTAAFIDDELIAALKITKEQQDRMSAINDEYYIKRRALIDQYGGAGAGNGAGAVMTLRRELDAKITESLSKELLERFAALKGKAFDLTQVRGPGRQRNYIYGGGRRAALLSLVENDAVQRDVGFTADETDRLKKLTEEFRAAVVEPDEQRPRAGQMSDEERKLAEEKRKTVAEANLATAEKFLPKLKEALTADQFTRLQQIYWQFIGVDALSDALSDSEMIKELPVSKELQDKIKAIQAEFDDKQKKVFSSGDEFRKKIIELDREQDARIDEALTKAQLDQFAILTGKEFDLQTAKFEAARRDQGRRGANSPRAIAAYPRRRLISLLGNEAVQKDLGIGADQAIRIKSFGDEVKAAVREALGDPPNFEQLSVEERNKARQEIENSDQAVTDRFLPKLKEILTAEQFARLKQIYWQPGLGALREAEVIEALSLSKDQQARLEAIFTESRGRRDEMVYSANINTILAYVPVDYSVSPKERQAERQALAEQNRAKMLGILTKEQQEKFAALKGKEFDFRQLRE